MVRFTDLKRISLFKEWFNRGMLSVSFITPDIPRRTSRIFAQQRIQVALQSRPSLRLVHAARPFGSNVCALNGGR
jgi:hypothetical protein